jgi:transposase
MLARRQKEPLRPLTGAERAELRQISRSRTESSDRAARAKALLAVSGGARFTDAARSAGRRSGDAVAHLVARFNREGVKALDARHGGGQPKRYNQAEEERILRELRRLPDRETDGTRTWSLKTLQRALRQASDGLPTVSAYVVWSVLHDAGYSWQRDRSWCETGQAVRKRKNGNAQTRDPDAIPKKTH